MKKIFKICEKKKFDKKLINKICTTQTKKKNNSLAYKNTIVI